MENKEYLKIERKNRGGKELKIDMETIGATLVVKIDGEIDHHTAKELKVDIDREIYVKNISNLVLDFDRVTFMDSSGIGVIAGRYKEIKARGGKVMVIRVKPQVDKILEISGLKSILNCQS